MLGCRCTLVDLIVIVVVLMLLFLSGCMISAGLVLRSYLLIGFMC